MLKEEIFGIGHQDFKNIAHVGFLRHFFCIFVFVVVFVIVFVFVFVFSYDFWIAFIISFQKRYGCRGLWSLWAEIMIMINDHLRSDDGQTHTVTYFNSTYRLGRSGRMGAAMFSYSFLDFKIKCHWFWEKDVDFESIAQAEYCSSFHSPYVRPSVRRRDPSHLSNIYRHMNHQKAHEIIYIPIYFKNRSQ